MLQMRFIGLVLCAYSVWTWRAHHDLEHFRSHSKPTQPPIFSFLFFFFFVLAWEGGAENKKAVTPALAGR